MVHEFIPEDTIEEPSKKKRKATPSTTDRRRPFKFVFGPPREEVKQPKKPLPSVCGLCHKIFPGTRELKRHVGVCRESSIACDKCRHVFFGGDKIPPHECKYPDLRRVIIFRMKGTNVFQESAAVPKHGFWWSCSVNDWKLNVTLATWRANSTAKRANTLTCEDGLNENIVFTAKTGVNMIQWRANVNKKFHVQDPAFQKRCFDSNLFPQRDPKNWGRNGRTVYYQGTPWFTVRKSQIVRTKKGHAPNFGLYAERDFSIGDTLAFYGDGGEVVFDKNDLDAYDPSKVESAKTKGNVAMISGYLIDGTNGFNKTVMINHQSKAHSNAELKASGRIVALEHIPSGAEITMSYGPVYWRKKETKSGDDKAGTSAGSAALSPDVAVDQTQKAASAEPSLAEPSSKTPLVVAWLTQGKSNACWAFTVLAALKFICPEAVVTPPTTVELPKDARDALLAYFAFRAHGQVCLTNESLALVSAFYNSRDRLATVQPSLFAHLHALGPPAVEPLLDEALRPSRHVVENVKVMERLAPSSSVNDDRPFQGMGAYGMAHTVDADLVKRMRSDEHCPGRVIDLLIASFACMANVQTDVYAFAAHTQVLFDEEDAVWFERMTKTREECPRVALVPVHAANHWYLVVVHVREGTASVYNSLPGLEDAAKNARVAGFARYAKEHTIRCTCCHEWRCTAGAWECPTCRPKGQTICSSCRAKVALGAKNNKAIKAISRLSDAVESPVHAYVVCPNGCGTRMDRQDPKIIKQHVKKKDLGYVLRNPEAYRAWYKTRTAVHADTIEAMDGGGLRAKAPLPAGAIILWDHPFPEVNEDPVFGIVRIAFQTKWANQSVTPRDAVWARTIAQQFPHIMRRLFSHPRHVPVLTYGAGEDPEYGTLAFQDGDRYLEVYLGEKQGGEIHATLGGRLNKGTLPNLAYDDGTFVAVAIDLATGAVVHDQEGTLPYASLEAFLAALPTHPAPFSLPVLYNTTKEQVRRWLLPNGVQKKGHIVLRRNVLTGEAICVTGHTDVKTRIAKGGYRPVGVHALHGWDFEPKGFPTRVVAVAE